MKRGYIVSDSDGEYGIAVVARTTKEAKDMALHNDIYGLFCDSEYINITSKWVKDAKVENLHFGVIENLKDGLKAGIYGWIDESECDNCQQDSYLTLVNGKALCSDCEEKEGEK